MLPRSLWGRIVVAQLVTGLLLAVGLPLITGRIIHAISDDLTGSFLADMAIKAVAEDAAANRPDGAARTMTTAVAIYQNQSGRITHLSGPAIDDIPAFPPTGSRPALVHGLHSDFYMVPASKPGAWVIAAQDRRHPAALLDDITRLFLRRFAVIAPLALVLSTLTSLLVVHAAMRPLRRTALDASTRDPADVKVRLDERGVPSEVAPVIHAANAAFERLEQAFAHERAFSSTVVHELRTSLSTILLRTELLPHGTIRVALEEAVTRAAGVIDQMIELRALSDGSAGNKIVCLEVAADQACEELRAVIAASGRTLALEVRGDAPALVLSPNALPIVALRNLILNANLHSTPQRPIRVCCDNDARTLSVRDEGPGIVVRGDADGRNIYARADGVSSGSSGLGIAIVHRLMGSIGGKLTFQSAPPTGTEATLHFPSLTA